jgi:hypothetical protein
VDNGALIFAYDPLVSPGDVELPRYINMMKDVNQLLDYALYVVILQDMHILLDAEKSDKLRRKIVIDPNGYLHSEFKDTSKYFSVRS